MKSASYRNPVRSLAVAALSLVALGALLWGCSPDPQEMIRRALDHIDKKRAALGLPEYDPSQFGKSGDARLEEIESLSFEERQAALYGQPDAG